MIIILSPAKTFKLDSPLHLRQPVYEADALKLVEKLKSYSLDQLINDMKISNSIASNVLKMYHSFGENKQRAIFTYDGAAYKAFDILSLDENLHTYLDHHLIILSGLYGVLKPFDTISHYRLEMQFNGLGSLYKYWQEKIKHYFMMYHTNEVIISLASDEYRRVIDDTLNIYDIIFKTFDGKSYKSPSMLIKKMRGLMARYIIENKLSEVNDIKKIEIDQFIFNLELSTNKTLVFVKSK